MIDPVHGNWVVLISYFNEPELVDVIGPFSSDVDADKWLTQHWYTLERLPGFLDAGIYDAVPPKDAESWVDWVTHAEGEG